MSAINPRSVTGVVNLLVESLLNSAGAAAVVLAFTLVREDGGAGLGFDPLIRGSAVATSVLLLLLAVFALGRIALGFAGADEAGLLRLRMLLRRGALVAFSLIGEFFALSRIWLAFRAGNYLGGALGTLFLRPSCPWLTRPVADTRPAFVKCWVHSAFPTPST